MPASEDGIAMTDILPDRADVLVRVHGRTDLDHPATLCRYGVFDHDHSIYLRGHW